MEKKIGWDDFIFSKKRRHLLNAFPRRIAKMRKKKREKLQKETIWGGGGAKKKGQRKGQKMSKLG